MQSRQNYKMKKRGRNSPLFPIEFFKIYFSNFSSNQLTLPPAPSALLLVNNIPINATLKDHKGKNWHVELEKEGNIVVVKDGWQEFVAHHSLNDGDYLIFAYDGNSCFNVEIYGKNGLKKGEVSDYYMFDSNVKEEAEEEVIETAPKTRRPPVRKKNTSQPKIKRGRGRPSKSGNAALSAVAKLEKATLASIKNPHFEVIIRRSRSARYCMHIPRSLVTSNKITVPAELKLRDEIGKLWPVKVTPRRDIGGRITTGWVNFYRTQKLKPGDKCIFEMIERNKVCRMLQAYIVRKPATPKQVVKGEIRDEE